MKSKSFGMKLICLSLLGLLPVIDGWACGQGAGTIASMPTLGGSGFAVYSVNTNGQITGFSYLAGDQGAHAYLYSSNVTTDLGTLGAGISIGYGVNNKGQVVGQSDLPSTETHAFYYDGTNMTDLGTLGGSYSSAVAINDAGQITGNSLNLGFENEAFLYSAGLMTPLGDLGGGASQAIAINQNGTVVGDSFTSDFSYHGFVYKNGAMQDLGTLGGHYSSVWALNNSDSIVGESALTNGQTHAFLYSNGSMTDLGTLGGTYSSARAVNETDQVAGIATTAGDLATHSFIYSGGTLTDLGTLGGTDTEPAAINNLGHVVGYSVTGTGVAHAFLWKDGQMLDLNTLLPTNSNWELRQALFISEADQIVGYGIYNGVFAPFILNPASANNAPIAIAGPDQTVECPAAVTLDGSKSSDPDNDALTYEWSLGGTVLGTTARLNISLPLGDNMVTLKVTDTCGASAQASVTVRVVDTTPPTGACPPDASAAADANGTAPVPNFVPLVQANDNCTARESLLITQTPAAGTLLGVGQHAVAILVVDGSGNRASCQVLFTVVDQTPPVITALPSPQTLVADANCSGTVPDLTSAVAATDNCTAADQLVVVQTPAPGTVLPRGDYTLTFRVSDAAGNTASAQVPLSIVNRTAPVIFNISASPSVLSPPNHQLVPVTLSVVASDNCDPSPVSRIIAVTCNEPLAAGEYQVTGNLTVRLAASRNSSGNGRIYTITVECVDASGNTSVGTVEVLVPKGNGNGSGNGGASRKK